MKKIYIKIDGMHCQNCETKIKSALIKIRNINEVKFKSNIAEIFYEENINKKAIIKIIKNLNYLTKEEYITADIKLLKNKSNLKDLIIILMSIILIIFLINKILGFNVFNAIPTIDSNITYGMLIVTGLLTSIHCISMCGAFNLMASVNQNKKGNFKRPILYNTGRILSYTILGGIIGLIGSAFRINDTISGIIILLSAMLMLIMALNMLKILNLKIPQILKFKSKSRNSFIIGLLNGFMPCGPLQAMQFYALSTGSFITGALSMFLFGIGTVPLMLLMGIMINFITGERKILINKIASVLILFLSVIMLNRALLTLDIDILKIFNNYDNFTSVTLREDYQIVEFDLSYDNYENIIVQKGIPVKMIINIDKKYLTGCNDELKISEFGIQKKLEVGKNIIEFVPTKTGTYTYACWMNMIKNNIKVIDDIDYFRKENK